MLKTIDRLVQFVEHVGLSARQFDLSIGAGNGYTLRMKKNNASIGSDVIETIIRVYPQLNVAWLLTGEGSMLKEEEIWDFDELSKMEQSKIKKIVERKVRERQEIELKRLLKKVFEEIERAQGKSPKGEDG